MRKMEKGGKKARRRMKQGTGLKSLKIEKVEVEVQRSLDTKITFSKSDLDESYHQNNNNEESKTSLHIYTLPTIRSLFPPPL